MEDNNDDFEDEDVKKGFKRYVKKWRDNDENVSESEEEMDEKEKSKIIKIKVVIMVVLIFLNYKELGKEFKDENSCEEV